MFFLHLAHFHFGKSLSLYEHLSKKSLHSTAVKKTLTAIITFELSYFNCDLQIAVHDEGSRKEHRQRTAPHSVSQAVNISLQACTVHFQECKNAFVRLEFLLNATQ